MPNPIPFHRSLFLIALPVMILSCCSLSSWAQSPPPPPLPLGSVSFVYQPQGCPPGEHGSQPLPTPTAKCYIATVDGCQDYKNNTPLPAVYPSVGVATPPGLAWKGGTIVIFSGGDGEDFFGEGAGGLSYAKDYYNNGYQVVQVAWATGHSWRDNDNQPAVKVMKYEGCRPATLLRALYDSPLVHGLPGAAGPGGMCAQGHSTGATAIAFALAWYGAGSGTTAYLDNVLLTSGPPQANIEAGCQFPAAQPYQNPIPVCSNGNCIVGSLGGWLDFTQYLTSCESSQSGNCKSAAQSVAEYTNNNPSGNCNNYLGDPNNHTDAFNQDWGGMSVVSANAIYSYPNTSVYAFLCATAEFQNNSAAQAWLYLDNVHPTLHHGFFRVDGCTKDEKIWDGTTPNGDSGFTASASAMMNACPKTSPPGH